MNQLDEGSTPQGEHFDFDQWLVDKDYLSLKHLFIKHGAISTSTLQISSSAMQHLMADPEFLCQPQMVPKVVMAIHELAVPIEKTVVVEKTTIVDRIVAVVLSEKEQAVIDGIRERMQSVQRMEEEVNSLQSEYTARQQRIEQRNNDRITAISAQMNETFDTLLAALTERTQILLDQLHQMKLQSLQNNNAKELVVCRKNIDDMKQFLKEKENEYNDLISIKKDNAERQRDILQIGKDVKNKCTVQQREIAEHTESLRKRFDENKGMEFNSEIEFITTKDTYDRIIADIGRLGQIAPRHSLQRLPQQQQSQVATDTVPKAVMIQISHDTDAQNEDQRFQHRPVRAWRFDTEQQNWRRRGKGQVAVYCNRKTNLWKLVFLKENHNTVRLLQWINGAGRCEYTLNLSPSKCKNAEPMNQSELEWFGADYTMDQRTPTVGKWKLDFIDKPDAASHFMEVFNDHIGAAPGVTGYKFVDIEDTDMNIEDTDINELDEDVDGERQDNMKQHVVEHKEEEIEEFRFICSLDDESEIIQSFKDDDSSGLHDEESTNMCGNSDGNGNGGDNIAQSTCKHIERLEETNVVTGLESDSRLNSFEVLMLGRTGVTDGFKSLATNTNIAFRTELITGKVAVRVMCRNRTTNKLVMNHWLPQSNIASPQLRAAKNGNAVQWGGFDTTMDRSDDDDDSNRFYTFICWFRDGETAKKFLDLLVKSIENNEMLYGPKSIGHLNSFEIVELFRWVEADHWKVCASNTTISFWRQPEKAMVLMMFKENGFHCLGYCFNPPVPLCAHWQKKLKSVHWKMPNQSIRPAYRTFRCRFKDAMTAGRFHHFLVQLAGQNENTEKALLVNPDVKESSAKNESQGPEEVKSAKWNVMGQRNDQNDVDAQNQVSREGIEQLEAGIQKQLGKRKSKKRRRRRRRK